MEAHGRLALRSKWVGAIVFVLASFSAFVLPFLFPPHEPVLAVTWIAGASNRVAVLAIASLSCFVLFWFWKVVPPANMAILQPSRGSIPRRDIVLTSAVLGIAFAVLGALISHTGVRWGDSDYFLSRLRDLQQFPQLRLYKDLEFPYGPALLLLPLYLSRIGLPLQAAYFFVLIAMQVLGLAMVAFVLDALPVSRAWRRALFLLCAFVQLEPVPSPNYTFFKFALPYAVLVVVLRRRLGIRAAATAFTGILAVLLVSPELAIGLSCAVIVTTIYKVLTPTQDATSTKKSPPGITIAIPSVIAPLLAYAVFYGSVGQGSLSRLASAGKGALNLILDPMPHLVCFLVLVVWLAPRAVGSHLGCRSRNADLLLGMFFLSLGTLPGALGRAYPLHILFDGWGFILLGAVAASTMAWRYRVYTAAAICLIFVWCFAVVTRSQWSQFQQVAIALNNPASVAEPQIDLSRLNAIVGPGSPVAVPVLSFNLATEQAFRNSGHYRPDYFPGLGEIWSPQQEMQKIASMRTYRWALAPEGDFYFTEPLPNHRLRRWLRLGYAYPQRNPPYLLGRLVQAELRQHWTMVARFGPFLLYRRDS